MLLSMVARKVMLSGKLSVGWSSVTLDSGASGNRFRTDKGEGNEQQAQGQDKKR